MKKLVLILFVAIVEIPLLSQEGWLRPFRKCCEATETGADGVVPLPERISPKRLGSGTTPALRATPPNLGGESARQIPQIQTGTREGVLGVRLALPEFQPTSSDPKLVTLTALFNQVLWDDLGYSGVVTLVSRSFYPVGRFSVPGDIKPEDWTAPAVDAQFVTFGLTRLNRGQFSADSHLWDLKTPQNREMLGSGGGARISGGDESEAAARVAAHALADQIVERIGGGVRGIAQTRIAFVSERSPGIKELWVMDYDGANPTALTNFRSTVLTPNWSPDGEKIAVTSYHRGTPDIAIISAIDRRSHSFQRTGGELGMTPAWSPDGSRIAFASNRDKNDGPEIYVADWNGRNMRRLTVAKGSDISPTWNPRTGREIAFVSERSGSPQIWIMDSEGTNLRRIIEEDGSAQNPAWSPDGQRIAFAWQRAGTYFDIFIHDLATGRNTQLTGSTRYEGTNERPTWAPDGRHIAFESNRSGTGHIHSMLADGTKVRQLTRTGKNQGPAWSGYPQQ
ncbi:MAG: PD40 domain-containing protein [Acidobacteria bacterium]|nr:PD40 domain-containing protein [Acidobacteriota bacterium]